jgi:hypothetical protein
MVRHISDGEADSPPTAESAAMTSEMFRLVSTCLAALFVGTLLVTALMSAPVLP